MGFSAKDKDFQKKVTDALFQRHTINVNKEIGTAYLQPESEDRINPSVTISRDEIKVNTGRDKLRAVIIDEYLEEFNEHPSLKAEKNDDSSITISVVPMRHGDNTFGSLSQLNKKNKNDLDSDPELGEDILY